MSYSDYQQVKMVRCSTNILKLLLVNLASLSLVTGSSVNIVFIYNYIEFVKIASFMFSGAPCDNVAKMTSWTTGYQADLTIPITNTVSSWSIVVKFRTAVSSFLVICFLLICLLFYYCYYFC